MDSRRFEKWLWEFQSVASWAKITPDKKGRGYSLWEDVQHSNPRSTWCQRKFGYCLRSATSAFGFVVSTVVCTNVLKPDYQKIKRVLRRSLRLCCPACGEVRIAAQPFHIRHHCPNCLALFKREDGFFVGAILANVVTTELVILLICFSLLLIGLKYESILVFLFIMALVFPVAFYHHSWSLWLGFDYIVESLPKFDGTTKRHSGHN